MRWGNHRRRLQSEKSSSATTRGCKMEALHVGGGRPRPSHSHVPNYSSSQAATLASASAAAAAAAAAAQAQAGPSDGDGGPSLRGMDSNLGALCEHVQVEGWKSRAFSDIVVKAMGHTFHLHRLLLSRSSYFRSGFIAFVLEGPYLVACQTPLFDWSVVRCGCKKGHLKDTCSKENGTTSSICVHYLRLNSHHNWGDPYDHDTVVLAHYCWILGVWL